MLVDVGIFLASLLLALIAIIIAAAIVYRRTMHRIGKAFQFMRAQYDGYRQTPGYQPLTVGLAQKTCQQLFLKVPLHFFVVDNETNRFWWYGYTLLLECAIALNEQAGTSAELIYGSYLKTPYDKYIERAFWLEFAYGGDDWVLCIEDKQTPDEFRREPKVHCFPTAIFQSQYTVHIEEVCSASVAVHVYRDCRDHEVETDVESK